MFKMQKLSQKVRLQENIEDGDEIQVGRRNILPRLEEKKKNFQFYILLETFLV